MVDEYIRKQDAVYAVCAEWCGNTHDAHCDACAEVHRINALPSADVVQVVRCKDCKHYYFADNRIPQEQCYVCEISGEIWKPDSFCSYGERREE